MRTFIDYAIQANLVLLFFLLIELFFFNKEKSFGVRRFFLLAGVGIALLISPLRNSITTSLQVDTLQFTVVMNPITIGDSAVSYGINQIEIITILYFVGVLFFGFHILNQIFRLLKLLKNPFYRWNGLRVYQNNNNHEVFSFFRIVSMNNSADLSAWEKEKILYHELLHAQQWHSADILIISLVQVLFWFNPLLYLYKRKLIQLHEFEADARSVQNEEVELYCSLLARVALQSSGYTLANHFNQPFTLTRILMMKSNNKKMQLWKITIATFCTVLFLGVMCFSKTAQAQENQPKENAAKGNTDDRLFTYVDEMPAYPGGNEDLFKAIGKELKYPTSAKNSKAEGTTLISFVIEKDGSLTAAEVKKGFNQACDKEALRVIQSMNTKWIPGKQGGKAVRTQMILPIKFKL